MASVPGKRFNQDERRRNADHVSFLKHRGYRWLWIALLLCIVTGLGYAFIDQEPRPNGGSWYGYTLGTIGLLLIVWLSLLGVRKRKITEGNWSLKAWTSAHVYLGLALIVVGTLHTGFQIGWNVHTLAYFLMLLVIISGLYGVIVYATLPTTLSSNRKQMTRGEMIDTLTALDRQLESAAQPLGRVQHTRWPGQSSDPGWPPTSESPARSPARSPAPHRPPPPPYSICIPSRAQAPRARTHATRVR